MSSKRTEGGVVKDLSTNLILRGKKTEEMLKRSPQGISPGDRLAEWVDDEQKGRQEEVLPTLVQIPFFCYRSFHFLLLFPGISE